MALFLRSLHKPHTTHNPCVHTDEGLTLENSDLQSLCSGNSFVMHLLVLSPKGCGGGRVVWANHGYLIEGSVPGVGRDLGFRVRV